MPSRRSHHKSRHGCLDCKRRKVKCDEGKPSCRKCCKRGACCTYVHSPDATRPADPGISHTHSSSHQSESATAQEQEIDTPQGVIAPLLDFLTTPCAGDPPTLQDGFSRYDFELLHHYTTSTYLSLSSGEAHHSAWQVRVPQAAFRSPFLMHALLAIAALHLQRLHPENATHYSQLAMHHHSKGIALFRPTLDHVTKENALPIFVFSSLIVCISLSLPEPPEVRESLQNILDIFTLNRGVATVLRVVYNWLVDSPLGSQLHMDLQMPDCLPAFDDKHALDALSSRISAGLASGPTLDAYSDAVNSLRKVYACRSNAAAHKSAIMAWPVLVPSVFHSDVNDRAPSAVAILSFYGALLHELRDIWWVDRAGLRIVQGCADLLGDDWSDLMSFTKRRVGLL